MEECDDGNQNNLDACTNGCKNPTCFDGLKNQNETATDCGGSCKPCSIAGLVINEVDYDQPGNDTAEYVEILNTTNAPISLTGVALALVNCSTNPPALYAPFTISLAGAVSINPGQYLVIAPAAFAVPGGVLKVNFAGPGDQVQNGSPDGLALVNTTTMTLLDALSYEGSCGAINIPGIGMVSIVEGMAANITDPGAGALARIPNGYDGNNLATDWVLSNTLTPGLANVP
ncbi:lamin tail domain-containing protein [Nannocystis sp.]|uniref:lamin tail domain-containing protein n=1 Tax=Nannocystis sp. TaxID=1962667 RepID=UPI0025F86B5A|nr:lamin tail domain-containing protein [Nannocystis sp.]